MRTSPQDSELRVIDEEWKQELDPRILALFEWENDPRVLELNELAARLSPDQVWFAAPAELVHSGDRWGWRVLICPFCGEQHKHDGGPIESDPRDELTKVEPGCNVERIGYAARSWGYVLCVEDPKSVPFMLRLESERAAKGKA